MVKRLLAFCEDFTCWQKPTIDFLLDQILSSAWLCNLSLQANFYILFSHTQLTRKCHFTFRFRNFNSVWIVTATLRSTRPVHLLILYLMTAIILGYDSPHLDFLHSLTTSPILRKNILFGTQFSKTLYFRFYLYVTDKLTVIFFQSYILIEIYFI